ncbi:MAG: hypothetical protein ACLFTH_04355 [Candidatus Woesearchaeota archaeon]
MKSKEIRNHIEEGYVRAKVIFEVVGKPKDHVENSIKAYLENIKSDENIKVIEEEYEPTDELEDGLFSTVVEADMLLKGLEKLTWLCINFTPASIEITEPASFTINQKDVGNWLNDLLSKLHEMGMVNKSIRNQQQGLLKNFNAMTRNAILLALKEPLDLEGISKRIGMDEKHAKEFVNALLKENRVREEKNRYYLVR